MTCYFCRALVLDVDGNEWLHQATCPEQPAKNPREDADVIRKRLNGVELGMWADTVLTIHPQIAMVYKPMVLGRESDELPAPDYIVRWTYPGFNLIFQRAERKHDKYGVINVYAVQKIEVNNEQKRKGIKRSAYRKGRKRAENRRDSNHGHRGGQPEQ